MATGKLNVDQDVLDEKLRFAGYHVMNVFLEIARQVGQNTGLDAASILILATINNASVQRLIRHPGDIDIHSTKGGTNIDASHFHSISRRAVADATGLNRELVRRKINKLIDAGIVQEDEHGVKTMNVVLNPLVGKSVKSFVGTHAHATNQLISEGILR